MIRTQEWKYIHRYPRGPHELYDLVHDPGERKNLVEDESQQGLVAQMRKRLSGWFERYVTPHRDGTRFPITGSGQRERIDDEHCGEEAFEPVRQ